MDDGREWGKLAMGIVDSGTRVLDDGVYGGVNFLPQLLS